MSSDAPWSVSAWRNKPNASGLIYAHPERVAEVAAQLTTLPPLVTSWEVERLREQLASAARGERFVLQGGDCAESFDECTPTRIASTLKVLLQMSLVLVHGLSVPVTRIGRFAGQYAKPRSSPTETRTVAGKPRTLPSYYGDMINRAAFDASSREPDPSLMIAAHLHAAMTLNFIRALSTGGFADAHHVEQWDLSAFEHADLSAELREQYEQLRARLAAGVRFAEALSEKPVTDLHRAEFFTSHEGLNLWYEQAITRTVPRREGFYDLSTHLPWIGQRTRQLDGAHVDFFRGVRNPVGVKLGPDAGADDVRELVRALNPRHEPGKLVLISRLGTAHIERVLPGLLDATRSLGPAVVWLCDPMHGNTRAAAGGLKTRDFADVRAEVLLAQKLHSNAGVPMAGLHVEVTGEDVTECLGGAAGVRESDLAQRYLSACDPRLNYHQAMELAFALARRTPRA